MYDGAAEHTYYLVTAEGLHVGQNRRSAATSLPDDRHPGDGPFYFGDGPTFDYFVPHDRITSVANSRYGLPDRPVPPDSLTAVVKIGEDGAFVQIRFFDMCRQFSGHTVGDLPAEIQRENVVHALIEGVAPEVAVAGKVCPDCAETVKAFANVCRYCGHRFERSLRRGIK